MGRPGYMQVPLRQCSGKLFQDNERRGVPLWAGATAQQIEPQCQGAGMLWQATVTTPRTYPCIRNWQPGTGVQIVTISNSYTTLTTPVQSYRPDPLNGVKGLDLQPIPTGYHTYAESSGSSYIDSGLSWYSTLTGELEWQLELLLLPPQHSLPATLTT